MQSATACDALAERDIGATTCHVRGHGDPPGSPGFGNDSRLVEVLTRVKHPVRDIVSGEQRANATGLLDATRTNEHRPVAGEGSTGYLDEGIELIDTRDEDASGQFRQARRVLRLDTRHAGSISLHKFTSRLHQRAAGTEETDESEEEALQGN